MSIFADSAVSPIGKLTLEFVEIMKLNGETMESESDINSKWKPKCKINENNKGADKETKRDK